ncbi:MutT/Nudix family protein [Bacillus sp. JCM 19046]|nr:MutT/Nudix family protein [Bacillus sp. JCM 19045]GAF19636.1 MutT/Nudix family protein [Bacillus sp. JCM 19046]
MYKQTLCFIRKKEKLLVLNREYKPLKGLWNGVGGKIEPGETPKECVIREVKEETGIDISSCNIIDKGIITWNTENNYSDGLYVFVVAIEGGRV